MNSEKTKLDIVANYGKLAKSVNGNVLSKLFACCDPGEIAAQVGNKIGYTSDQMASVPANSNLGVGCGNPSALAQINQGETVVDLGAGAGFDAFIVAREVGLNGRVIGVDLSEDMLALARKNAQKGEYTHVEFLKGDIENLPLAANIADHVISNCVINLSSRKDLVFKEAYRVLKANGHLSVSDIVLKKDLPEMIKNSLAGHIACISGAAKLDTYLTYVRDAGFKDVKIEEEKAFPLELMISDPQIKKMAAEMDFDLNSEEAADLASRVVSISLTAIK